MPASAREKRCGSLNPALAGMYGKKVLLERGMSGGVLWGMHFGDQLSVYDDNGANGDGVADVFVLSDDKPECGGVVGTDVSGKGALGITYGGDAGGGEAVDEGDLYFGFEVGGGGYS